MYIKNSKGCHPASPCHPSSFSVKFFLLFNGLQVYLDAWQVTIPVKSPRWKTFRQTILVEIKPQTQGSVYAQQHTNVNREFEKGPFRDLRGFFH